MSFMAKYKTKPENALNPPKRVPRSVEPYVKRTVSQTEKLLELDSMCERLFTLLHHESFRNRGAPFELPIERLITVKKLGRQALRRRLLQLEAGGLLSITRRHRKPPLITILE
jgi:hypothetical protein